MGKLALQALPFGLVSVALLVQIFRVSAVAEMLSLQATQINRPSSSFPFEQRYSITWGQPSISDDGSQVQLTLDKHSGSGFMSRHKYSHGFFSASIKLPAQSTAGVVVAFYMSNRNTYAQNHDEIYFKFIRNLPGEEWVMQTNIYGNGSVARGREERFNFWFDPTADFHDYSILWNDKHVVFMADGTPIREIKRTEALKGDYPSKPMALYATISDGSGRAPNGGKHPLDFKLGPFVATFTKLKVEGCESDSTDKDRDLVVLDTVKASEISILNSDERAALKWVRNNHLYYSYCGDKHRYPVPLAECSMETVSSAVKRHRARSRKSGSYYSRKGSQTESTRRSRTLVENASSTPSSGARWDTFPISHPRFSSSENEIRFAPISQRISYSKSRKVMEGPIIL